MARTLWARRRSPPHSRSASVRCRSLGLCCCSSPTACSCCADPCTLAAATTRQPAPFTHPHPHPRRPGCWQCAAARAVERVCCRLAGLCARARGAAGAAGLAAAAHGRAPVQPDGGAAGADVQGEGTAAQAAQRNPAGRHPEQRQCGAGRGGAGWRAVRRARGCSQAHGQGLGRRSFRSCSPSQRTVAAAPSRLGLLLPTLPLPSRRACQRRYTCWLNIRRA